MSHFDVGILGDIASMGSRPSECLELRHEIAEYKDEWENGERPAFFCDTNSTHGRELASEDFLKLQDALIGEEILIIDAPRGLSVWKKGNKEKSLNPHDAGDEPVWFKTVNVLKSGCADDKTGRGILNVTVKRICAPQPLAHKYFYAAHFRATHGYRHRTESELFAYFLKDWAGIEVDASPII